jgi:molecular chaperone DnaK
LIEKNSTIPTRSAEIFTTVSDGQETVEVHVLQGEETLAKSNKSLGRFKLVGIPAAPKGKPQIEVIFAIDSSGIVNVTARDMASGKSQGIQVNPAGGLKPAEVEKLSHRLADERSQQEVAEELTKLRGQIAGRVETSRRSLATMREGLGEPEAQRIEALLAKAEAACGASEKATLEDALRGLEAVAKDLTSVVLSRSKTKGRRA